MASDGLAAPRQQEKISRETFQQWTQDCGVKCIQKQYDEILQAASKNGHSLSEELKKRGYKDFNHFQKSCPRFNKFCWPIEFAELGSGYVLYFQFLGLLMLIFIVQLLLQIPAMAYYSSASDVTDWRWHNWQEGYSGNDATACQCIGNETGFAATCGAWDMDLCPSQADCNFSTALAGKWLCQSWCYTSEFCPTRSQGSMSNVHIRASRRRGGLVKSYSACPQEDASLALCKDDFRARDIAYGLDDVDTASASLFISTGWITPGNTGPDEATNAMIPTMYTCCVFFMCVLIFAAYNRQCITDHKVNVNTSSPNDFAIMVKGLPSTATDEESIMQFFREHAVRGKTDTEIVKVVIGWDMEKFRESRRSLVKLSKELQGVDDADPKAATIKQQIEDIKKFLRAIGSEDSELKSSGVVVVIFRYQSDLLACLDKWSSFWGVYFGCEPHDFGSLWRRNHLCKGPALPRFPIGARPIAKLAVTQAPNPGDINWEELAVPFKEKLKMMAITNSIMLLLLGICFGITYAIRMVTEGSGNGPLKSMVNPDNVGEDTADEGAGSAGLATVLGLSLLVALVNGLLTAAAKMLGDREYHDTKTDQEFSQALKMSVAMVLNTAGVLFFMYATPQEWYVQGGLIDGAWSLLLMNSIVPPLVPYIDFGYRMRGMTRSKLTDEKLEHMNKVMDAMKDPKQRKDPGLQQAFKRVKGMIESFKRAYAPTRLNTTKRYASAMKTFICCLLYQPAMPLLSALGIVALFMQYAVDKYLLLRWVQRPEKPQNADLANFMVLFIKFTAPIGLSVSFYVFITPSYSDKDLVFSSFITSLVIAVLFSFFFPLSIWSRAWLSMPCNAHKVANSFEEDYFQAQHMWAKEMKYHKDQPIYKVIPESKNPEFLELGKVTAAKAADMKVSGDALGEDATAGAADSTVLKGGKVVPSSDDGAADDGATEDDSLSTAAGSSTEPVAPAKAPSTTEEEAAVLQTIDRVDAELSQESGMNPNSVLEGLASIQPLWPPVASSEALKARLARTFDTLKVRMATSCAGAAAEDNDGKLKALVAFARKVDDVQESLSSCSPGFCNAVVRAAAAQDLTDAETELAKEHGMNPMLVLKNLRNLKLYWAECGDEGQPEVATMRQRLGALCGTMRNRISTSYDENPEKRPGLLKFAASFDASVTGLAGACEANLQAELEAKG